MQPNLRLLLMPFFAMVFSFATFFVQAQTTNAYADAGLSSPTVTTDKDDYAPGEVAHITGSGWTLDDSVHVEFKETPDYPDYHIYDLAVNSDGTWRIDYQVELRHIGVQFTVIVNGKQSNFIAKKVFTDANIQFSEIGLPPNSSSTVTITYWTVPNGQNASTQTTTTQPISVASNGNITIATVAAQPNTSLSWTFNNGTGPTNSTYISTSSTINGSAQTSPITVTGNQTGNNAITGVYQICSAPTITTQPGNQSVTYGANATFIIAASGTATLSYKWQVSTDGTNWSDVSTTLFSGYADFTTAQLSIIKPPVSMSNYLYRCQITNSCGNVISNGSAKLTVAKANQTISVTTASPATATYNTSFTVAATASSGLAVTYSSSAPLTNTGANFTMTSGTGTGVVKYNQAGDANYNAATEVTANVAAAKATAIITVTPYDVTYNGDPHTATGTAKGAKGEALSGLELSKTAHTNAGSYTTDSWSFTDVTGNYNDVAATTITDSWSFTDVTGNYNDVAATTITDKIAKADPAITVTPYDVTYNGDPHTATGTAKGVETTPADLSSLLTLTGTAHTNAGDYTADAWTFAGNSNYNAANGSVHDKIGQSDATIIVNGYTGTYDATAHGATGTAKGAKNEDLGALLHLGNSFTNVPGGIANWTFDGNTNYKSASGTAAIIISKAAATITLSNLNYMFDNTAKSATATITPAGLTGISVKYYQGTTLVAAPTNVGSYNVEATLNNVNYQLTSTNDPTKAVLRIYAAPTVILVASNPVPVNTTSTVTATFGGDVVNPTWVYTSQATGQKTQIATPINNVAQLPIPSSTPAVYSVYLTYDNGVGDHLTTPTVYAVFYDPNAGFVTGGGWITSPVYSALKYMQVSGKANFGFESKYEKGKTVPSGNTEFQFQEGGMNFKSSVYEYLVIAGTKAQYKGSGTINGTGNYGFMLTGVDGDLASPKTADLFRIKIWDKNNSDAVVYDNQYGATDGDALTTKLGGGSIVIHDTKSTTTSTQTIARQTQEAPIATKFAVTAFPNPTKSQFTLKLESSNTRDDINLVVVNEFGKVIEVKTHLTAAQTVQIGSTYIPGVYFVQVMQGDKKQQLKLMKLPD